MASDVRSSGDRFRIPKAGISTASALVALVLLAGCGGHAKGVMTPVALAQPSNTSQVDMLVATTRQPSGDPATLFSGERSPTLSMTDVAVSIPPDSRRAPGTVQWPRKLPPNPETDFAVTRVREMASEDEARTWFRAHNKGGHVLLFVHGFNNRYEDGVFRLAQIVHDSGAQATPMLFTWPSRARVFDYNYDKESTNYSRTALEDTLRTLANAPNVKDVTILAHSMGTWLTMEALRQMGIRDGKIAPKIENVILASPDIDLDVFAKQWTDMGDARPKFTIFVSQDDRALALSRLISGDVSRLGAIDPSAEPYRTQLETAGITAIDLTKVETDDGLHHGKFAESPEIVQLIGQRIIKGQTLTDSEITLGEGITAVVAGTAKNVGTVAAATITAPVTIIEGRGTPPKKVRLDETLASDERSQRAAP
ncbi:MULTISPECIES: alpha/beta hydrolase [Sinorhizobium]|nr:MULTISPECIES: alpha/beta hydrolase [Sinorhizobium]RVE92203.1 alpha/beta fold hydrolase [Sinorhizobium meliloti]RVG75708.1 alpha/beta fold hydrolase [Sinorhizobium meliloti]RVH35065.1 alpha/beta fold hydrolase [Sinorhizobium meliloti]WHS91142.1 alpha/beta hydrolase [Sinorhizobium kummerowiae]WRW49112.1 alpha/beta hydrolase [Sinorhizobium kummerowiae]